MSCIVNIAEWFLDFCNLAFRNNFKNTNNVVLKSILRSNHNKNPPMELQEKNRKFQ